MTQPRSAAVKEHSGKPVDADESYLAKRFWPEPLGARVALDVHIPARIQHQLFERSRTGAENFRLETRYDFNGPFTTLYLLDEGDPNDQSASSAVNIVYRYLRQELERHQSEVLVTRVGPSPFHMDVLLRPGPADQAEAIEVQLVGRYGYEKVQLRYSPSRFASVDEATRHLKYAVGRQLSLYYDLRRARNRQDQSTRELAASTAALVDRHSTPGFNGWARRMFTSGALARRLGLAALDLQTAEATTRARYGALIREVLAQSDAVPLLQKHLEDVNAESAEHVIANASEVVRFVEGGRRSEFEVLVLSGATILGGVAGAVASLVVSAAGGS